MDQPMDVPFDTDFPKEETSQADDRDVAAATDDKAADFDAASLEDSLRFVTNWNRLVSMTNWEKGKIISDWRAALVDSGAPVQSYSDEAWSRLVGNVSGQHVGRLRRVYDRFGEVYERYPNLFWSHFQAALDWTDAEMWLEGAVQNGWSVSQMRSQRWEAMGAPDDKRPNEADIVVSELDEDVDPGDDSDVVPSSSKGVVQDVDGEDGLPFDPEASFDSDDPGPGQDFGDAAATNEELNEAFRAFTGFPPLPDDLAEAFEAAKIAILNHKLSEWRDTKPDTVLSAIGALKALVISGE